MAEVPRHRQDRRTRATRLGALVSASAVMLSGVFVATGPAGAAPPPGQDFNVTTGDLEFILKQIQISEAHAEDVVTEDPDSSPLCRPGNSFNPATQTHFDADGDPCVGAPTLPFGVRTVDGRWNNLLPGQDGYGAGGRVFPRLLEAQYRTADPVPAGFPGAGSPTTYEQTQGIVFDGEVRTISNLIVDQTTANPAAVDVAARVEGAGIINGASVSRLAGPDRYATAATISASHFGANVPVVYIATGENFPDSLAGGPVAAANNGPLLLVTPTGIPGATAAELLRGTPEHRHPRIRRSGERCGRDESPDLHVRECRPRRRTGSVRDGRSHQCLTLRSGRGTGLPRSRAKLPGRTRRLCACCARRSPIAAHDHRGAPPSDHQ